VTQLQGNQSMMAIQKNIICHGSTQWHSGKLKHINILTYHILKIKTCIVLSPLINHKSRKWRTYM